MPNIMINDFCNLRCPYCFADEPMSQKIEMSMPTFLGALDFSLSVDAPHKHVGIIGGEPTLHSNFENILRAAICSPLDSITVFTNGTNLDPFAKLLVHRKVGVLVNFNDVHTMGKALYNKMGESLIRLQQDYLLSNFMLGLNVYETTVPQLQDMLEMCKLLKLKKVRISITVPTVQQLQEQHILAYFAGLKQTYIDLCRAFDQIGVALSQDCNYIPRCVFSNAEITMLTELSEKYSKLLQTRIDYISPSVCHPVIDILPDLRAIRCFGMSEALQANIEDFETVMELSNYFTRKLDTVLGTTNVHESCDTCRSINVGCNMGCIRAKMCKLEQCKANATVCNGDVI